MPAFPAQLLAQWTGGRWTAEPSVALTGFCVDSRLIRRGEVFVAIKTDKRDGHDFLAVAAQAGAGAAIVTVPNTMLRLPQLVVRDPVVAFQAIAREHRRRFTGRVVGISGSAGKTSTKDLLALLLGGVTRGVTRDATEALTGAIAGSEASFTGRVLATEGNLNKASVESAASFTGRVLATEGNLNNHLGVPLTLTRLDSERHDFAVVEAGISAPGEMQPLAGMIEPDVSLITVIAPAHTQELGGLEGVAREKAKLAAATRAAGVAVFSNQTAAFAAFRELHVSTLIVEQACALPATPPPKNTVYLFRKHEGDFTTLTLAYGAPPPLSFTLRRVSDGMAFSASLAICAALWLGVPIPVIQARIKAWQPARLRGEIRREGGQLLYVDCYNANPASMVDALRAFDTVAPVSERRLFVLGSMEELGEEAPKYHRAIGQVLKLNPGDLAYLVGANAGYFREGALEVGATAAQLVVVDTVDPIIDQVRAWRGAVFVKGSRRYQLEKVLAPSASAPAGSPTH